MARLAVSGTPRSESLRSPRGHVLVKVAVGDFPTFLEGFRTRGLPLRRRHGSRGARVFQDVDDPNAVSILFDWDSRESFQAFLDDPEVKDSMRAGGALGRPSITFLAAADELDS